MGGLRENTDTYLMLPEPYYFKPLCLSNFGGDLILTATFLINRTPTKLLDWETPMKNSMGATSNTHPLRVLPLYLDYHSAPSSEHVAISTVVEPPTKPPTSNNQPVDSPVPTSPPLRRSYRQKHKEPKSFSEVVKHVEWRDAMQTEIDALEHNHTWKFTSLPAGKHHIGCKWVFKTKLRADGTVKRYKERLVGKGFNQIEGVDCIDNFSLVANSVTTVNDYLHSLFTIKDIGKARNSVGIYVAKIKYVMGIIKDTGLTKGKTTSTPFPLDLKLSDDYGALLSNPDSYRRFKVVTMGFCIFLGDAVLSWKTKKQSTVSRSTAEAEYRSMAASVCELHWISYFLSDLGVSLKLPIRLFCDNQATLHIMANPVFHERTKHIKLHCRVVRDAYKEGFIAPSHIRSSSQTADLFTKVHSLKIFASLLSKLGLVSMVPSPTCGGAVEYQA
ncbi:UNVERIFIED_CONTAM: Retrovirus-related Pol polyprotein from transposon RE2 [Sesamum latifolium]|uniref:Retrovirus-related Pol polyprotein from transposon RE2 n=1 Tax=Sesamum latifolium TaxID=2727402 RepID=A0AAW2WVQ2_9LAMI